MATSAIIEDLRLVTTSTRSSTKALKALSGELALAWNDPKDKAPDLKKFEFKIKECREKQARLGGVLKRAQGHVDAYSKNWAKKAVRSAFTPKVAENRKVLVELVDKASKTHEKVGTGVELAEVVLMGVKQRWQL